ncbi:MAG: hypothetical protein IJ009_03680 [Clostridia bacterium]|nr:hypothetical protein [Clostridia bacterium]
MNAKAKNLRTGCLFAAAFFLFNPNITILDVLPDFIGYLLILWGISGLRDIIPHFEEATVALRRLLWMTALRLPAFFVMMGQVRTNGEFRTLVALCFGIVELILLFPFIREFFAGMDYIGERFGAISPIDRRAARARRACYIALTAKPILAFLPEISLLFSEQSSDHILPSGLSLSYFRPHFVVLSVLVGIGFGIYFLSAFLPFCRSLARDKALEPLLHRVREDVHNPLRGEARIRRIRRAALFLTLGTACMLNIHFDGINYLPNALGYLFFLLAAVMLLPFCRGRAITVIALSGVMIPVSVVPYVQKAQFFNLYGYYLLGRSRGADELYGKLCISSVVEAALLLILCVLILVLLFAVIKKETGYRYDNINNYSSHLPLHRALRRKATFTLSLGILTAIAGAADVFLRRITERIEIGTADGSIDVAVQPQYGWFQWVVFVLCVIWIVQTSSLGEALGTEVERRYSLD